jgi:beta-lactamase class A
MDAIDAHMRMLFEQAGGDGQLCVQSLDGERDVAVRADQQAVSASVFKVSVALAAETQFADGRLDPQEQVTLPAASRTPGPTGFSLFQDDVEVSLRDLVVAMHQHRRLHNDRLDRAGRGVRELGGDDDLITVAWSTQCYDARRVG